METVHVRFSAEDRRAQIIETATELFARQGYEGTTTREIAESARVNEAIIFRHFPGKEELYWAVIEHQCSISKGQQLVEAQLASGGDIRQVFINVAEDFLRRREEDDKLPRLLFFTALENHRLSSRFFQTHIVSFYETLADYIRERIAEGAFRDVDPIMAARGFFGMLVYHYMVQDLFGGKRFQKIDIHTAAESLVDLWLNGMMSQQPLKCAASGKSRAARNTNVVRKSEK
jgi:AcrR family transcriptional regulator